MSFGVVVNRAVQANVVVMLDVALHQTPGIFQRQGRSRPDALSLERFVPTFDFSMTIFSMTIMVALDFDQWKILLQGPGVIIDGGRQADKTAAHEEARRIAERYICEEKHEALPTQPQVEWTPIDRHSCLNWQP
jgi:hypothetical protein